MRKLILIVFATVAITACRQAERPAQSSNAPPPVPNAAQQEQPTVPLGASPTPEELERQRLSEAWRQLPSFKPSGAPGAAAPRTATVPIETVEHLHEPLTAESLRDLDAVPFRVPIRGDVHGPSVVRVQVLLDRANFSGGSIDGRWGKNSEIAVYWFQSAAGLPQTGEMDAGTLQALVAVAGDSPAVRSYNVVAADLKGPFRAVPSDVYAQAKLDCLCYESPREALAEKFHTAPQLLDLLNPGADLSAVREGQTINVLNVRAPLPNGHPQDIARIVISVEGSYLHGFDASGALRLHAPSTLGSKFDPSPNETLKITGVFFNPQFRYQPKLFSEVPDTNPEAQLQPGPNSPVGVVWMALSKPHYGIHGTSEPETIGYATSHGCVRLTNWDAHDLAHRVRPGIAVAFVDPRHHEQGGP